MSKEADVRLNRLLPFIIVAMALAITLAPGEVVAEEVYAIDVKILAVSSAGADEVAVVGVTKRSPEPSSEKGPTVFGDVREVRVGDLSLTFDGGRKLLWNGQSEPPASAAVEVLSSPRLLTRAGERAVIRTGSRLEYFTKEDGGSFRLHVTEPESAPGVEFGCTVEPGGGGSLTLDYDLKLVVMEGRETLPGVSLDVGKPILRARKVATRIRLKPGQWSVVSGQLLKEADGDEGDVLLVLLRVTEAGA
jgi:hypothetical protein